MNRFRALALVLTAVACSPLALAVARPALLPAAPIGSSTDTLPFSPTSFWRSPPAAGAPIDAQSAVLVRRLSDQVSRYGAWMNTTRYSVPVYEVDANQPAVHVTLDANDSQLQAAFAAVPMPASARGAPGTDASAIVWQRSTDTIWEFWRLRRAVDGWHAKWGGRITNASQSSGIYPAPYGTAASGLSELGGMVRTSEMKQGQINHTLGISVAEITARIFRWPATRTDGKVALGIPMGTRFRIPPDIDVTKLGLPPAGVVLARAAQRYGMVVTDTAGCVCFNGEDPGTLSANPWPTMFGNLSPYAVLRNFPWRSLQVLAPSG
jgi:hypothetical protein